MADRTFEDCTTQEVHSWYLRLVNAVKTIVGEDSLATIMLENYLRPELVPTGVFTIPDRFLDKLKRRNEIINYLSKTYRPVFLSQIPVPYLERRNQREYGGIGPRLAGSTSIKRDNGFIWMDLQDENVVQFNHTYLVLMRLWFETIRTEPSRYSTLLNEKDKEDLDFFLSLHSHGIYTEVWVSAEPLELAPLEGQQRQILQVNRWRIRFIRWKNTVSDDYDFNPDVGFALPNPDYGSRASYAILPGKKLISHRILTHKYLKKFTKVGLAREYKVDGTWEENNAEIMGSAEIDISGFR